ncbi:MAG: hypothetical protein AAF961_01615 [Planctomycetota bacterium]
MNDARQSEDDRAKPPPLKPRYGVVIEAADEIEQRKLLEQFLRQGYVVRAETTA